MEVRTSRTGRGATRVRVAVVPGTLVRNLLRELGHAPEGSAVLVDGRPVPLDRPLTRPVRIDVVPTFSGG